MSEAKSFTSWKLAAVCGLVVSQGALALSPVAANADPVLNSTGTTPSAAGAAQAGTPILLAQAAPSPAPAPSSTASDAHHESKWYQRVDKAQSSQPHWITPLATVTPRLEEEFRYDQTEETLGNGAHLDNYDTGKGLELIPTDKNEVILGLPPYEDRTQKKIASGLGDWPFLLVKQRLSSANEQHGNYIVSAFLGVQAPIGIDAYTSHAWLVTPTLAAGKGWGKFDVQGTLGVPVPTLHEDTIGTSVTNNVAFQYHPSQFLWPEVEFNTTYWADGLRTGKTQVFLTPGIVLGRFPLGGREKAIVGVGYQDALSPKLTTSPELTPVYNHAWIVSARLTF